VPEAIVLVAGHNILEGQFGGHPAYVRAHARAALRAGFQPHLFSIDRFNDIVETDFGTVHRMPASIDADKVPILRYRKYQFVWRYRVLARAVAAFVLSHRSVRLIHSFGVFGSVGVMAHEILSRHGVEVIPVLSSYDTITREVAAKVRGLSKSHGLIQRVVHELELIWVRQMVAPLEKKGYFNSRLVLVNYEAVRQHLIATYDIGDKIRKLPYSPETAFRQPSGGFTRRFTVSDRVFRTGGVPLVVAVSRHDPRKGVDVLLRALARLKETGVPFRACLVGDGPLISSHRRLAEQLGLGGVATIVGPVSDSYSYLEHADVFVLPSLEEGSGSLSLLEALQAGVACVASNIDGIPEDVVDGETALLVPPGKPVELAEAIEQLIGNATLRSEIAERGRRTFETRFSAEPFTAALRQTYAELGVLP
jgi:glycosyltransferase involved in cell wall biosynthesis